MPFTRQRPTLVLAPEKRAELDALAGSRTSAAHRAERARILLAYADGHTVSAIARERQVSRPTVERCIDKALQFGVGVALGDLPGRGAGLLGTFDEPRVRRELLHAIKPRHVVNLIEDR